MVCGKLIQATGHQWGQGMRGPGKTDGLGVALEIEEGGHKFTYRRVTKDIVGEKGDQAKPFCSHLKYFGGVGDTKESDLPKGVAEGFPDSTVGKESSCNAADPGSISGLGTSPGEGTGYLLQYSWASLVAQLVKNLPAMRETWVQSLDWEEPLEKRKAIHSSILAWRIPWTV